MFYRTTLSCMRMASSAEMYFPKEKQLSLCETGDQTSVLDSFFSMFPKEKHRFCSIRQVPQRAGHGSTPRPPCGSDTTGTYGRRPFGKKQKINEFDSFFNEKLV